MAASMSAPGSTANVQRTVLLSPSPSTTHSSTNASMSESALSSTRYAQRVGSSQARIVSRYWDSPMCISRRDPTPCGGGVS